MAISARLIPSIDTLVMRPAIEDAVSRHGHARVVGALRKAAGELRERLQAAGSECPDNDAAAALWIETRALADLGMDLAPSLRRAINATGVILHTNLGRAPLAAEALARIAEVAAGYSNLEYDLGAGERGHRHAHTEHLLTSLSGAGSALVVNNNAGAMLVVLATLATGREVIVSRGELVEIGGGFRVPDVLAQSGATLREVGTTNRTRAIDYLAACSGRTAMILRVHRSNFRIDGFTEQPTLAELASVAQAANVPLVEDLGSGWLGLNDVAVPALAHEPSVRGDLAVGVDVIAMSGDKLLGGPQAGIILGRADLVDRIRTHPLMRAVRADKLTHASLEATLGLWMRAPERNRIPLHRMLTMPIDDIQRRAQSLVAGLASIVGLSCRIIDGTSTIGGGASPGSALPTRLVSLSAVGRSANAMEARLRAATPPVIARIVNDAVVIDLRTVGEDEDADVARAIRAAAGHAPVRAPD